MSSLMTASFIVLTDRKEKSIDRADGDFRKEGGLRGKIRSPILVTLN